jgi:predicted dehydrogenase
MPEKPEVTRRQFLKNGAAAGAGLAALSGITFITDTRKVFGANDRIRYGVIGCGGRAEEDLASALKSPNTECVAVADVYTRRLDEIKKIVPNAKPYQDFRRMLDDKSIDAVVIVTPQHQHALNFVPAIQAGKDVYQEKTMAFNPDHARRMKRALEGSGRVVQVGIQSTSNPVFEKVKSLATPEAMGDITVIHTHMYRNARWGGWKRELPADCDAAHVDWKMFQGEAAPHDFDPNRVINWRFFWEYSGGNVFENMIHQVGFWYKVLNLKIPRSVAMSGGNYLSPGMEVPDTMNVSMDQPENILFTWNSGFGNRHYNAEDDFLLGTKGTVVRGRFRAEYIPEGHHQRPAAGAPGAHPAPASPEESMTPDIIGRGDGTDVHFQNFFDCVRSRKETNCPFDLGYRSAIAAQMANRSYREGRTVRWDAEREEIV